MKALIVFSRTDVSIILSITDAPCHTIIDGLTNYFDSTVDDLSVIQYVSD